jgi:FlaA1/EpsC-like NDP-sugar epimerase
MAHTSASCIVIATPLTLDTSSRGPFMSSSIAVITGAARGIGRATARRFLAEGWSVALLDIEAGELAASAQAINLPQRVLALRCDVSDPEQVTAAFDAVKRWSTMPASRCSSRCWTPHSRSGAG